MDKKFIYGIAEVTYNSGQTGATDMTVGYIEKNSWDWGGSKPEATDVEAEQVPDVPVLTIMQKNGQISPTFNLIQLDYENLKFALGGTLVGAAGNYTGWKAPSDLVELRGKFKIKFVSGQTMTIHNGLIMANLGGKLTLSEVSKIECQLKINKPATGGTPYEINDTVEVEEG